MTSLLAHGVRLPLVLRHAGVHLLDDIGANGAGEDLRHGVGLAAGAAALADDADSRPRRHRFGIRRNLSLEDLLGLRSAVFEFEK